jgi:hypothetical protein
MEIIDNIFYNVKKCYFFTRKKYKNWFQIFFNFIKNYNFFFNFFRWSFGDQKDLFSTEGLVSNDKKENSIYDLQNQNWLKIANFKSFAEVHKNLDFARDKDKDLSTIRILDEILEPKKKVKKKNNPKKKRKIDLNISPKYLQKEIILKKVIIKKKNKKIN